MLRRTKTGWHLPDLEARARRYLASGEWPARTVAEAAAVRLEEDEDRIIVTDEVTTLTRRELFEHATLLGSALHRRGLPPGAVVAFQLPNWHEACVIATACALYGYVLSPLLLMYRERELGFILSQTGCDALFLPGEFRKIDHGALLERALPDFRSRGLRVFRVRAPGRAGGTYEDLLAEGEPPVPLPDLDPAGVKAITFTSGTTGRPKGVLHSHHTAHATVRRCIDFWTLGDADRLLVPSPVGHIGGSLYAFELPWFTGAAAHLMETWDARRAVELIERDALTFCAGATPFLQGLLHEAREAGSRLPSLRRFICGGASVSSALVEEATAHFERAVVTRAYGSSEVPLICPGIRTRDDALHGQTTDGEIDAEVRIVDFSDTDVPEGAEGDVVVRSPSAFIGYLETEDEAGQFTPDGFFRTGDLGQIVDRRFLRITGRRKEIIIRLGENISAAEVETALTACDAVKRAAVVGIPNARTGERAVAFVELEPGAEWGFADMQAFLGAYGLARQKFPEELHVLETLPTNSIGKVMKLDLKKLAEERTAPP